MTTDNSTIETIQKIMRPRDRPRVIFCDWHGVLCRKPFWHSITDTPGHSLHTILTHELDRLFTPGNREGRDWMCGTRTSRDILTHLATQHRDLDVDLLLTQLVDDIAAMPVDQPLINALHRARSHTTVVLATDNIDLFASTFRTAAARTDHRPATPARMQTITAKFDDILSSSEIGVLKVEDPEYFFGPWLERTGLTWSDALLIDDRSANCHAFEQMGGTALEWVTHSAE
ncbi:hypothetical protein IU450_33780 [Nocardia abscessus]|uniref:hypothetical protein n=1 Tax=Nocardia abscessus TaxID=120957 RepID=UPI00189419F5|nr:hypothetical protein [Nocardia abscessus]MBF6340827.1 hypothetical protein [Nocardia abscessus]